jgi:hypothetical protein
MNNNKCQRGIALLCTLSFLLTSCTTLQGVRIPGATTPTSLATAQVGDKVVVTLKTGETKTFRVTAVEPDALVGEDLRIAYADMSTVSVKRMHVEHTVLVVATIGLVLAVAATIKAGHSINDAIKEVIPK